MKKAIIYLNLVLFLIFIINLPVIDAATTTVTLNPTEDAGISLNEPDSNFGEYVGYTVWEETYGHSENWGYKIYLKFDLSSIPSSATIESATLSLYAFQILLGSEPYTTQI
ncbi:DNRLRE domain-containing protein [bacterium]|nr:DNRLRE domain-containing protein [bacterium]